MTDYLSILQNYLETHHVAETADIHKLFKEVSPSIKRNTVNWRMYELTQKGYVNRVGKGKYRLGTPRIFRPIINRKMRESAEFFAERFPLVLYCVWDPNSIKEFSRHIAHTHYMILEIEKEAKESVYQSIKEIFPLVLSDDIKGAVSEILPDVDEAVLVRTLISESPTTIVEGIPVHTIEKVLVDIFCDVSLFTHFQGNEKRHIFQSAHEKYAINRDKMLRYAARRGKRKEIEEYVNMVWNDNDDIV